MSATFTLFSPAQHLMGATFSNINCITPCATSVKFSLDNNFCIEGTFDKNNICNHQKSRYQVSES